MKKITLVLAVMLLSITSATATKATSDLDQKDLRIANRYRYSQPILFVERGVEFLVFPSGEIDFNTNNMYGNDGNYYKNSKTRKRSINNTYGAPGTRINYSRPRGTNVSYDGNGRVRRVSNVPVNYDAHGRVKRIGSVYMKYRRGKLMQVGGLHIQYNRWGNMIGLNGTANYSNQGCGFSGITECTIDHFQINHNDNKWYNANGDKNDYYDDYYYKKGRKVLKNKNKRRKNH